MIVVCTFNPKHCPFWSKYFSITYRKGNQMVLTFKHLADVVSSHSDIYEKCVKRNLDQKIRLLVQRQPIQKITRSLADRKLNGFDF